LEQVLKTLYYFLNSKLTQISNIGSFGKVCLVKHKGTGRMMVWKKINYGQIEGKGEATVDECEVNILGNSSMRTSSGTMTRYLIRKTLQSIL